MSKNLFKIFLCSDKPDYGIVALRTILDICTRARGLESFRIVNFGVGVASLVVGDGGVRLVILGVISQGSVIHELPIGSLISFAERRVLLAEILSILTIWILGGRCVRVLHLVGEVAARVLHFVVLLQIQILQIQAIQIRERELRLGIVDKVLQTISIGQIDEVHLHFYILIFI